MSPARSTHLHPGVEVIFVPGHPAREGRFALWQPGRRADDATDRRGRDDVAEPGDGGGAGTGGRPSSTIEVVVPAGERVRRLDVPVTWVAVPDLLDELVALPADATTAGRSAHGWAAAARAALQLVARGRLLPGIDEEGIDSWRLGPLDPDDVAHRNAVADALPPAGHATSLPGSAPRRVTSPRWAVARFFDAVADAYVRTAGASEAAGHETFAGRGLARVTEGDAATGWLTAAAAATTAGATVALRLEDDDDPTTWTDPSDPFGTREAQEREAALAADREAVDGEADDEDDDPDEPFGGPNVFRVARIPAPPPADEDLDRRLREADAERAPFRAVLEISSVADPSLVLDAADLWAAPDAVAQRFGPAVEDDVLLALRRGARVWPPLARLLDQARPDRLDLDQEEVSDLFGPLAARLAGAGIEVRWPKATLEVVEMVPVLASAAESLGSDRQAGLTFESVCTLQWKASVGGEALTEAELRQLAAAKRGVVRLRGRWVRADPERLARAQQKRKVSAGEALAAAISGELVVDGEVVAASVEGPLAHLADRLRATADRPPWTEPAGLEAELRPYQRDGVAWLEEMAALGLGGVLADDMGLGKTVQLLALHLARRDEGGPTLVVCPVSVLGNWARESARFSPSVPVVRFHGADRSLDDLPADALVLTTYGVVRRSAEVLAAHPWGLVAADEAQAIKNPLSRTAKAMRRIPADARFALTGTPVENRLVDLWALLDWSTPGLLGPLERFRREVAVPVERDRDTDKAEQLSRLVRPFLLRRRKIDPDIAPDLPPKTETDHVVPLTAEQATLYAATVEEVLDRVAEADGMSRRGLVLKLLTGLKQICNHPDHYLGRDGVLAGRSGKLDAVDELVDTVTSEGDSLLVFTQFVAMGKLLQRHLGRTGRPVEFLHGSVSIEARQSMVDRFQAGEVPVLVISVKAGGTGLNLTRATHVVHYDRWWNPAVEDQASDRAWRIGQDRPVQVHRMVCEGTIEDRISLMLADKRALADSVVTPGEGWVSELGDDDLRALVSLSAEPEEPGS
jgi:hypothetical protein